MGVHGSFFLSIRHYSHGVTPLANYWRSLQFSTRKTPVFGEPCQEVTFYKKNKQQSHAKSISTFGYHPGSDNEADFPDCYVAPCCITSSKDFLNIFKHSISIYIWVPRKFCRVATFGTCTSFLDLIAVHCRSLFCSLFCALVIALWLQVSLWSPLNGSYRLQNATRCYKIATSIAFYMLCFCSRTSTSWFSLPKYHVTNRQGTEASPPQALELGAAPGHERPRRWTQSVAPCDAILTVLHASFMASKNRCIESYHLFVDIW